MAHIVEIADLKDGALAPYAHLTERQLRTDEGLFIAESENVILSALEAGVRPVSMLAERRHISGKAAGLIERLGDIPVYTADDAVEHYKKGERVILVRQETSPEDFGSGPLLVLEHVQDPGNVGTLFRTAEAAGAGGVILDRETADPYSPKVLRATMGAVFRLPFVISNDLPGLLRQLRAEGFSLTAAHLAGTEYYDAVSYPARTAFLIGNEGNGLSEEITSLADKKVRIPMEGQTESLNAAVAGALLLYEAYRQRRSGT